MALVRYELYQDSDDAYHQALINAARFGPWAASIQRLIVELGLDTWETLSPDAQYTVNVAAGRALKRQPAGLNAIVDTEQAWQTLCGGQSVGHKRIQTFPQATVQELRCLVTDSTKTPRIRSLVVYHT